MCSYSHGKFHLIVFEMSLAITGAIGITKHSIVPCFLLNSVYPVCPYLISIYWKPVFKSSLENTYAFALRSYISFVMGAKTFFLFLILLKARWSTTSLELSLPFTKNTSTSYGDLPLLIYLSLKMFSLNSLVDLFLCGHKLVLST